MTNTLEFRHITKYFPGVKALDDVSFVANGGEVLAFLGDNGAGKSTLLKTLNGDYQPDEGQYLIDGAEAHFKNPHEAIEAGISVIYQERQILPALSVAENIYLGRMPVKGRLIDTRKLNEMAKKIIDDFELPISPTAKVHELSIAYQQMVEIMKSYSRENLKVICFDEPTASLSDAEIECLFRIINKLRDEGKIIIYVSHRMKEIQEIADKVAIFKDGRYVTTLDAHQATQAEMVRLMVGRDLGDIYDSLDRDKQIGDVLLEVKDLESDYVDGVSFQLHKGEVLGFSGLVGAGRTEVMRAIIGADRMTKGEVFMEGKPIHCEAPSDAQRLGIVLVPEDRKDQGILANLSVAGNINISLLNENSDKFGFVSAKKEAEVAERSIREFAIKTPSPDKKIVELSGGNQQKCIVARWMETHPKVLILDEPTKGIDVGAKSEFYNMICSFAKQGLGVILISSELPEVIGLSDRIIVMRGGKISGEVMRENATEQRLLSLGMMEENAK
ncbi:MAG: sugar ABC transporter ATP-binding protein [Clostridia bacterium]|nr:sugar ABC transporter ATP-binding protein [Clostridia bacterium]